MPGPFVHDIDPVLAQVGGVYLWWYGFAYTAGFLGLFLWLRTLRDQLGMDRRQVYDLSILCAGGVLLGGRAVEVIFYEWSYYGEHLAHIAWVWLGGMSTHGLLLGGTLGAWLFCRLRGRPFLPLADELAIPAALVMGLGRLGNFVDGQIVGSVTDVWWAVKFPDSEGFRHAVVLYDGLKNLLLVPVLILLRRSVPFRGVLLGTFLFGYGFFRILVDFFREYRMDLFGLPPGQQFNAAMAIMGIGLVVWAIRRRVPRHDPGAVDMTASREPTYSGMVTRRLALCALLLIPLVIPSDWTQDVPERYGERHAGIVHSPLYPRIIQDVDAE
jgi:phosphatidylglycerol:prolipoprotein diacylglycerol transferase